MKTTRRTFLGGLAAASVPVTATAAEQSIESDPLAAAEYHAAQLCKAMDKLSPWKKFRFCINSEFGFAFVTGDEKPVEPRRVA